MGLFNFVRNAYRAITGNISVEQEQGYKKWLSEREAKTGIKSNYNKKIRITQASKEENLRVQRELQARVNASVLERNCENCAYKPNSFSPIHPSTQRYFGDLNPARQVLTTSNLERYEQKQKMYASKALSLQERINAAKNKTLEQNREAARSIFSGRYNQVRYA